MMSLQKRLLVTLLLLAFGFSASGFNALAKTVETEEPITVILHKLAFEEDDGERYQNDGTQITDPEYWLIKDREGMNGIPFSVFDATDYYYSELQNGKDYTAVQEELSQLTYEEILTLQLLEEIQEGTTATVANEKGIVTFDLPQKVNGRNAAYLIVEKSSKNDPLLVNLLLVLPILNDNQEALTEIHLYPKNLVIFDSDRIEKELASDRFDYDFGEKIDYQINYSLPKQFRNFEKLIIRDRASEGLRFHPETLDVFIKGIGLVEEGEYYSISSEINGFTLDFTDYLIRLAEYPAGTEISIHYQMSLSENSEVNESFLNYVLLETDNNWEIDWAEEVYTGGKRFEKRSKETDQGLEQAMFVVQNDEEKYLQMTNGKVSWINSEADTPEAFESEGITVFASASDGQFSVSGLHCGIYFLREISAPEGYLGQTEWIEFQIDPKSPANNLPLIIYNAPERNRRFPNTGEKLYVNVGTMIVFIGLIVYRKFEKGREK